MANKDSNMLEVILKGDITDKLDAMDKKLAEIQKNTENASKKMGTLVSKINDLGKTLSGSVNQGVSTLVSSLEKLNKAMAGVGTTSTTSMNSTVNATNKVMSGINGMYSELLQCENAVAKLNTIKDVSAMKGLEIPASLNDAINKYKILILEVRHQIQQMKKDNDAAYIAAKQVYDAKHASNAIANEQRKASAIARTTKELEKQRLEKEKLARAQEKDFARGQNEYLKRYYSNLGITIQPKTIEQYRIAIANLKRELQKMPIGDKSGIAEINRKMELYRQKLKLVEGEQRKVSASSMSMGGALKRVAASMGIVFSVQSLINFGRKIVEVTGEFELQHRALQAIIGDTQTANALFDKTVALAVKSPYRIKDLITYTKQLAAYRIESDKLYETNKMLADISAGLGVDMGRLILAYGQVKAANYLRGQELRQFSEAGVNILGELAKYFEEIEGRAVSTGDVFDRVSKRMVSFEDVAVVLKRLTEEGGMFFNMQEIQAETLKGQIENLKDSFDIFMNTIGQKNKGVMVDTIKSIRRGLENINSILPFISTAFWTLVSRFAILRVISAKANAEENGFFSIFGKNIQVAIQSIQKRILAKKMESKVTEDMIRKEIMLENSLKKAREAGGTAVGGWVSIAATALIIIAKIITKANAFERSMKELSKTLDDIARQSATNVENEMQQYTYLANKLGGVNVESKEREEILAKINNQYGDYLDFSKDDLITQEKLLNKYDEVNRKIKERQALQAYEEGVSKIDTTFADQVAKEEETLRQLINDNVKTNKWFGTWFKVEKKESKEILDNIKKITKEMNPEDFDEVAEQVKIINKALQEYYNLGNVQINYASSNTIGYFDTMIEKLNKIDELSEDIDISFGDEIHSKELSRALSKVDDWYDEEVKRLNEQEKLGNIKTSLDLEIEALKREAKKKKIDIKVAFRLIPTDGENNSTEQKARIDNWANETVKYLNDKMVELIDKYGKETIYNSKYGLFINEEWASKGINEIIKRWKDAYESNMSIVNDLTTWKEAGAPINEADLEQAKKLAEAYTDALSLLGVMPEKKKQTKKDIDEWTKETIKNLNKAIQEMGDGYYKEEIMKALTIDQDLADKGFSAVVDNFQKLYDWIKKTKEQLEAIKAVADESTWDIVNEEELQDITNLYNAIVEVFKIMQIDPEEKNKKKPKKDNSALERLNKQISAIKEANSQYKKYLELFDDTTSFKKVKTEFKDLFDDLNISNHIKDWTDFSDTTVKNVFDNELKSFVTAAGHKGKEAADKFKTEFQYAFDKDKFDEAKESFSKAMEDAFGNYELSRELEKMGIGGDLIKNLFDITPISLDQLNSYLDELNNKFKDQFNGKETEKWYESQLKKINEMQLKELEERMKRVAEYIKDSYDKILYEQKKGIYDISFGEQLVKEGKISAQQFTQLVKNVSKDVNDSIGKIRIDAFKDTDLYIAAIGNLSAYTSEELKKLSSALKDVISQNSGQMTAEEMEQYYNALEKVTKKINELNKKPFGDNVIEKINKIKEIEEKINKIREKRNEIIQKQEELEERIKFYQTMANSETNEEGKQYWLDMIVQANQESGQLQSQLNQCSAEMGQLGAEMGEFGSAAGDAAGTIMIIDTIVKSINQGIISATKSFEDIKDMAESFGAATDEGGWREASNFFSTLSELNENAYQGWEDLKNGNIAGALQNVMSSVIRLIKNINLWADSDYQEEIDKQAKTIEKLERSYKRLEEQADYMWDRKELLKYNEALKENIDLQIEALNAQIAAEKSKKNVDQDTIDEWNDSIEELTKKKNEIESNFIKELGGIGKDGYRDAAEAFVDSWLDAFKETGDGIDGLDEHFNDMIENIVKKQAVTKITKRLLEPLFNMIDKSLDNGLFSENELYNIQQKYSEIAPKLNEELSRLFTAFGITGGESNGELTGLQKGIQGVTEQTAEIIAAYLNSIRFYIEADNANIKDIKRILSDNSGQENPILAELRNIAQRANDIYGFLWDRRDAANNSLRVSVVN